MGWVWGWDWGRGSAMPAGQEDGTTEATADRLPGSRAACAKSRPVLSPVSSYSLGHQPMHCAKLAGIL